MCVCMWIRCVIRCVHVCGLEVYIRRVCRGGEAYSLEVYLGSSVCVCVWVCRCVHLRCIRGV